MTPETALNQVYEFLLGDNSIPQQLRMKRGLDHENFSQLINAIKLLIDYYAEVDIVPKKLALCMVDVYGAFSFREGFYNDDDTVAIEDAGLLLQELATELFS